MNSIGIHKTISGIMSFFFRMGLWHREKESPVGETKLKLFYSIFYLLFPISLTAGSILSDNKDETIFLAESAITTSVMSLRLFYIIWKKKRILDLTNRICASSIDDSEEFKKINNKLETFMKFINVLLSSFVFTAIAVTIAPFIGKEKKLFFNIGFPLDWKNNEFAYWLAFTFITIEVIMSCVAFLFPIMTWYLMLNCALRYEMLGKQIRNMGALRKTEGIGNNNINFLEIGKNKNYLRDLTEAVKDYNHIRKLIHQLESLLSIVFFVELSTSSLCICSSVYCLTIGANLMEYIIYVAVLSLHIFEIFMVMYFGNKIKSSSDRLSYYLFESNWIDQSKSCKICVIVFGGLLKRPHQLVVGKVYPLTLGTFTTILNSAYSMFNVLQNVNRH